MRIHPRSIMVSLVAVAVWITWPSAASAQVVIDMPPPPKKTYQPTPLLPADPTSPDSTATTVKTSSSTTTMAMAAVYPVSVTAPEVGEVALVRYSNMRAGTRDTYMDDGSYFNGYGMYSYPYYNYQYVWGWPWWGVGFFPGFTFHGGCSFHGSNCK